MRDQHTFRDRLLAVEPVAPTARDQLLQEIHKMFIKKLSWPRRVLLTVLSVFALASSAVCGYLAITEPTLPALARAGLGTGVLFGLSWLAVFVIILRRGEIDLQRDHRRMAQMVWGFTLLMVIFFVMIGMTTTDRTKGLMMIAQALVFLISAAVYWLSFRIEESELNVKEHLLRLELQITKPRDEN